MSENALLLCDISKGMFSTEYAVTYPPDSKKQEWQKSVFLPVERILYLEGESIPCKGWVQVTAYNREEETYSILHSQDGDIVRVVSSNHIKPLFGE